MWCSVVVTWAAKLNAILPPVISYEIRNIDSNFWRLSVATEVIWKLSADKKFKYKGINCNKCTFLNKSRILSIRNLIDKLSCNNLSVINYKNYDNIITSLNHLQYLREKGNILYIILCKSLNYFFVKTNKITFIFYRSK